MRAFISCQSFLRSLFCPVLDTLGVIHTSPMTDVGLPCSMIDLNLQLILILNLDLSDDVQAEDLFVLPHVVPRPYGMNL